MFVLMQCMWVYVIRTGCKEVYAAREAKSAKDTKREIIWMDMRGKTPGYDQGS